MSPDYPQCVKNIDRTNNIIKALELKNLISGNLQKTQVCTNCRYILSKSQMVLWFQNMKFLYFEDFFVEENTTQSGNNPTNDTVIYTQMYVHIFLILFSKFIKNVLIIPKDTPVRVTNEFNFAFTFV